MLSLDGLLLYQKALDWIQTEYPNVTLGLLQTMMEILAGCWQVLPEQIHEGVLKHLTIPDKWTVQVRNDFLFQLNLTLPEYEQWVLSGEIVDGLVVLLSVCYFNIHITIVHGHGVWTTRATSTSETSDVMTVATDSGLHQAIPAVN